MAKNCCCDFKPGETREFTIRIKLGCSEDGGSCTVTANCCDGDDQDCCTDKPE